MSRKVSFKLSGERLEAALKFAGEVDLPLDRLAEKSLFLVMQQTYSAQERLNDERIDNVIQENQKLFDRLALTDVGPAPAATTPTSTITRSYTYDDGFGGLYEYTATFEKSPSGEWEVTGINTHGWEPKSEHIWKIVEEQALYEFEESRGP